MPGTADAPLQRRRSWRLIRLHGSAKSVSRGEASPLASLGWPQTSFTGFTAVTAYGPLYLAVNATCARPRLTLRLHGALLQVAAAHRTLHTTLGEQRERVWATLRPAPRCLHRRLSVVPSDPRAVHALATSQGADSVGGALV